MVLDDVPRTNVVVDLNVNQQLSDDEMFNSMLLFAFDYNMQVRMRNIRKNRACKSGKKTINYSFNEQYTIRRIRRKHDVCAAKKPRFFCIKFDKVIFILFSSYNRNR